MKWYYLNESSEVVGPVSEQALKELNAAGAMATPAQVCREGTEEWITLADALEAAAPGGTTEEIDTNEVAAEGIPAYDGIGDTGIHPDERQEEELKHSFSDRLKSGAREGLADIKRTSRGAAIHAQIEKLKNVDLRKALFALGEKCYESGILQEEFPEQFQQIRDLDDTIAEKRETVEAEADETKIAALKRMGKDAAKTSHAQALTVKRQHLVTELGRQAYARMEEESLPELEAEIGAIEEVEGNIRGKEVEARGLGGGHAKGWKNRIPGIAMAASAALIVGVAALFLVSQRGSESSANTGGAESGTETKSRVLPGFEWVDG